MPRSSRERIDRRRLGRPERRACDGDGCGKPSYSMVESRLHSHVFRAGRILPAATNTRYAADFRGQLSRLHVRCRPTSCHASGSVNARSGALWLTISGSTAWYGAAVDAAFVPVRGPAVVADAMAASMGLIAATITAIVHIISQTDIVLTAPLSGCEGGAAVPNNCSSWSWQRLCRSGAGPQVLR